MPTDTLTPRQINRATLARQMLLSRARIAPLDAIKSLVGMQAQWPRPPFLGLWTRVEGFQRAQLATLFEQRKVVRATFLRGTIHVVTAKNFLALRPAIQPVLEAAMHGILRDRIAGVDLDRLTARARTILGKEPQTFETLRDRFLRADPKADERAMGYAIRMLLPLVQVPVDGAAWAFPTQSCFALAEQWLGREIPSRPSAPDELILRYLAGYGPASAADFQAWSGISRQAVRDATERLRPRLRIFRDEKRRELFDLPDAPRPDADVPVPVRLIPEYDNLITARGDERFVARANRPRVFLSALRIAATVLVDGFVAGTWKLQTTRKRATVIIEPFATLSARVRKDVVAEAEAVARFAEPGAAAFDVTVAKT